MELIIDEKAIKKAEEVERRLEKIKAATVRAFKIFSQDRMTVRDLKNRNIIEFLKGVQIIDREKEIVLVGDREIYEEEKENTLIKDYIFKINKEDIVDVDFNSIGEFRIEYAFAQNTIIVEYEEELMTSIENEYINELAKADKVSKEQKMKQVLGQDNVDWGLLTYEEMDMAYKKYYTDEYKDNKNTNNPNLY